MRAGLNPIVFEVVGAGQHDVAVLAGLGELHVVRYDAGNLRQNLLDGLPLGRIAADRVRPDIVEKTHGEILALQLARFQNLGQMKPRQFVVEPLESGREGETSHIDRRLALPQMTDGGAALADVAREGGQTGPGHAHLFAVIVQMVASVDGRGCILGIHASKFHDGIRRNLSNVRGPFRRAIGHVLLEQRPGRGNFHALNLEAALHSRIRHLVDKAPGVLVGIPHHIVRRLLERGHLASLHALEQQRAEERILGQLRRTLLAEICRTEEMAVILTHKQGRASLIAHEV